MSSHKSSCSYYDIDEILAEDQQVSCTNMFDFSLLGHLHPDYVPSSKHNSKAILPENSRFKMPLWSVEKWTKLGFVRLSMSKQFGRRARQRLAADPGAADLRSINQRYFLSGIKLINLIHTCRKVVPAKAVTSVRMRRREHLEKMQELTKEGEDLRQTLVSTYTGDRLRRIFDWTQCNSSCDQNLFTSRLTEMELQLFQLSASAVNAHTEWKANGAQRIPVMTMLTTTMNTQENDKNESEQQSKRYLKDGEGMHNSAGKRVRVA